MAAKWVEQGAEWLHVVDLDGAFEGKPREPSTLLREIARRFRTCEDSAWRRNSHHGRRESVLDAGIQRVVLGTSAVRIRISSRTPLTERPGQHRHWHRRAGRQREGRRLDRGFKHWRDRSRAEDSKDWRTPRDLYGYFARWRS